MSREIGNRSSRRVISLAAIGLGAILLLLVPVYLLSNAVSGNTSATLEGTWLIISVVSGMALIAVGASVGD